MRVKKGGLRHSPALSGEKKAQRGVSPGLCRLETERSRTNVFAEKGGVFMGKAEKLDMKN